MRHETTHHSFFPKVYPYRRDEFGIKLVIGVSVQERRFPDPRVSEGQEFDQVIVVSISHSANLEEPMERGENKEV